MCLTCCLSLVARCCTASERIDDTYRLGKKLSFAYGGFTAAMSFIGTAAVVLVLFYGGLLVLEGELSAGVLTSFILYVCVVYSIR